MLAKHIPEPEFMSERRSRQTGGVAHRSHRIRSACLWVAILSSLVQTGAIAQGSAPPLSGGFHGVGPRPAQATPTKTEARPASPKYQTELDPIYDPTNPDYRTLQRPAASLAALPLDRLGSVDWMAALRQGLIRPLNGLRNSGEPLDVTLDIIMHNTGQMDYVRFSHSTHTEWLACQNCHNEIFQPKAGSTRMRMADIFRGRYCGVCHDKVAFITYLACERCHNQPREKGADRRGGMTGRRMMLALGWGPPPDRPLRQRWRLQ